jgi:phosphate-selective porin OprO/OprP
MIGIGLLVAAVLGLPRHAQANDDLAALVIQQAELLRRLDARVVELEAQVEALQRPAAVQGSAVAVVDAGAAKAAVASVGGSFRLRGGPEWTAADGIASAKLRGRLQTEYWGTDGSTTGVDYPSGMLVRAIRLGLEGRINPVLSYVAEIDFGVGQTVINDAYLQYKGKGPFFVRAGNIKPDFSLENMTGIHQTVFMERGLPNIFAISDETLAVSAGTSGKNWSFGASVFGDTPNVEIEGDEAVGIAARTTFAPILSQNSVLHFGVSAMRRHLGSDAGTDFRIRQRPESRVFPTRLIDTGRIPTKDVTILGAEIAAVRGPWTFQAEHIRSNVDLRSGATVDFDGAYTFASWFATGESRPYNASTGKFGRIKPKRAFGDGGWGAIEFGLRYSTLDLTDGPVLGGEQDNLTFGINWYFTEYSKTMFNWAHFDADKSLATRPLGSPRNEGDAFGLRAQVDW